MHPRLLMEVTERIKSNQEKRVMFHQEKIKELESQGLFDFYMNKLSKGLFSFQKTYGASEHEKNYYVEPVDESSSSKHFIKVAFRPESTAIQIYDDWEEENFKRNISFFYGKRLLEFVISTGSPIIQFTYPKSYIKDLMEHVKIAGYSCEYIDYAPTPYSRLLLRKEVVGTIHSAPRIEDLLSIAERLLGDEYTFRVRYGAIKTNSSTVSISIPDELEHALFINNSDDFARSIGNDMNLRRLGSGHVYPFSEDEKLREEELGFLIRIAFNDLIEQEESLFNPSSQLKGQVDRYVRKRFSKIQRLPEAGKQNEWNFLHPSISQYLLSGTWREKDNYRSKLILWLESLMVQDSTGFGLLLYYDGRLKGLETPAFLILPFHGSEIDTKVASEKYIFLSEQEARKEMELQSNRLMDYWNQKR